ncbi:MAG: tyrosine-type recombinase/integrase [Desulfovibrio sp.]
MNGCRPLEIAEYLTVCGAFSGRYALRDKNLFILGCSTGYRIRELLSLRVRDGVEALSCGRLVREERYMKAGTRGVLLADPARAALISQIEYMQREKFKPSSYLFRAQGPKNTPLSRRQAHRILGRAYKSADLCGKLATHTMRKTYAKIMYDSFTEQAQMNGAIDPVDELRKALGHRDRGSTVAYIDWDQGPYRTATSVLNQLGGK